MPVPTHVHHEAFITTSLPQQFESPPYNYQTRFFPQLNPKPGISVIYPGQTIVGNVGLWVNGVLGYAYQLLRNGVPFQSGGWTTGNLYVVQASDIGSVISLWVTASNNCGAGPVARSPGVLVVS
jgi:hypothetical protein